MLLGKFLPFEYESWISRFKARSPYRPGFEPGRDLAQEMIHTYYKTDVKLNVPKGNYCAEGALLNLSEIVRHYIISDPTDKNQVCLNFYG